MSNELKEFYRSYKAWLDAGAPENTPYERCYGLCSNLAVFTLINNTYYETLTDEMLAQFGEVGLSAAYPFETPSEYHKARKHNRQHLNMKRIKWVEDHAK